MLRTAPFHGIPDARIHHQSGIRIPRGFQEIPRKGVINHDESSSFIPWFPNSRWELWNFLGPKYEPMYLPD
jgi:hypothetical protein